MVKFSSVLSLLLVAISVNISLAQEDGCPGFVRCPTYEDYELFETFVFEFIEASTCPINEPEEVKLNHWDWNPETQNCNHFTVNNGNPLPNPLGARLVRHAFHDSAGFSDGYVNLNDPNNNGLTASHDALNIICESSTDVFAFEGNLAVSQVLNRADCAAWAYIAALRNAADSNQNAGGVPTIPITVGREVPSDPINELPTEHFPASGGHDSGRAVEDYFMEFYSFNEFESATILGAHSLGGADVANSGFAGPWTSRRALFDESYYSAIVDSNLNWELRRVGPRRGTGKYQWSHSCDSNGNGCRELMLHVDMALYRDIDNYICTLEEVNDAGSDCQEVGQIVSVPADSDCDIASGRVFASCFPVRGDTLSATVEQHAVEPVSFIESFAAVYHRMITFRNGPTVTIRELQPTQGTAAIGDSCEEALSGCAFSRQNPNPYECNYCASGFCGSFRSNRVRVFECVEEDWVEPVRGRDGNRNLLRSE